MEEIEFTFDGKQYKMREANGAEDLSFQELCTNELGILKISELWKRRIKHCMVSPKITDAEFAQLSHKELSFLIAKWQQVNTVDIQSFLEEGK